VAAGVALAQPALTRGAFRLPEEAHTRDCSAAPDLPLAHGGYERNFYAKPHIKAAPVAKGTVFSKLKTRVAAGRSLASLGGFCWKVCA